jgi:nucleolar protein 53
MPVVNSQPAGSGEAPKTYSQPSRKGKKAWRKNVDVTEVEQGLVELNDEIIGGGVIREKPSEDLFTIDVKGDAAIPQKFNKHVKKGLKADEIIASRSAVPAVSMRKRPSDKTSDGIVAPKRQRTDWVSHKELARLKRIADGEHDTAIEVADATYDMWDAPAPKPNIKTSFLEEKKAIKAPKSMKQKAISLVASGKDVPAVQKPAGGYSYNPVFTDYEQRLTQEGERAVEAEKKRLAAEEAERLKKEAAARSAAEAEAAEERANLSEWEEDSEWEGFQSGVEDERPAVKRPGRKTQAQRNKIKRRKEEERLAKHKAALKLRRAQEARIRELAEEVSERDQAKALALTEQQDDSDSEVDDQKLRKKQLGKYRLPEKDLELVLPDELQESLRLLKPEGNLLKDRYRSMVVRGKVEARRHLPFKRKANTKLTEKWTHKDFMLF